MTCRDLERLLAEGTPLTQEAENHLQQCPGCLALVEALSPSEEALQMERSFPAEHVGSSLDNLFTQLTPVTPLPSDAILIAFTLWVFVAFTVLIAAVAGLRGYLAMTTAERVSYCGPILFFGLLFSAVSVQAAIPGAKVRVQGGRVVVGSLIALAWIVSALFPDFGLDHFVSRGVPCLRFGSICAALFGLLAAGILRLGCITDVGKTSLLVGCFAGFAGIAVLSLHCPLQNAPHIILWHLGTVAVSALGGFATGYIVQHRRQPRRPGVAE